MKRIAFLLAVVLMLAQAGCSTREPLDSADAETSETITFPKENFGPETVSPSLPDPSAFLGVQPDEIEKFTSGNNGVTFYLKPEEEALAVQYLEILEAHNLKEIELTTDESDTARTYAAYLEYKGGGQLGEIGLKQHTCHVFVGIRLDKGDKTKLLVMYADGFSLADTGERADRSAIISEPEPEPESKPKPEPAVPSKTMDPASKELPDLMYFLNTRGSTPYANDGGMQYGFQELPLEYKEVLEKELLSLLQQERYQLKLIDSERKNLTENTYTDLYYFTYTGNGSGMDPLNCDVENCHVILWLRSFTKKQELTVSINCSDGFELKDPGQRTSLTVEAGGSSGGGSSIGGWDPQQPDYTKLPCLTCNGDRKCNKCNGYGYIWIDDIKSDCTRCSSGNCPACGGSGTRD